MSLPLAATLPSGVEEDSLEESVEQYVIELKLQIYIVLYMHIIHHTHCSYSSQVYCMYIAGAFIISGLKACI